MKRTDIDVVMALLVDLVKNWQSPVVTLLSQRGGNPFKVLISCILSLRTKDQTTGEASTRLFALADTPAKLGALSLAEIETAIYPVGFYHTKAAQIREISRILVENYECRVPDEIDELLKFKGVGRKTANLVVTLGYNQMGICVDTHVHRICNRWGYVSTRTPEETEIVLRDILPPEHWIAINDLLVTFGQNQCSPVSPQCSTCRLASFCDRAGVEKFR